MRQPHLATRWIKRVALVAIALAVALTLFIPSQANAAPAAGPSRPGAARWSGQPAYHRPAQPVRVQPARVQPVRPQGYYYCVQRGDTLSAIARRSGVSVQTLARVNRIPNPHRIYAGQTLLIPASAHHWR